jgi:hypothetical protein
MFVAHSASVASGKNKQSTSTPKNKTNPTTNWLGFLIHNPNCCHTQEKQTHISDGDYVSIALDLRAKYVQT